ncbi:MAG TPA: HupE/UreJ family protein, partial [Pelobium sp.]
LITSLNNIIRNKKQKNLIGLYLFPLFFGLIHGLGFSNYLKSLLGNTPNIVAQLFAFNFGLEIGQIVIVFFVLLLGFTVTKKLKVEERDWHFFISSAIFGIAFIMAIQRFPF